jgi:hypothetical protein
MQHRPGTAAEVIWTARAADIGTVRTVSWTAGRASSRQMPSVWEVTPWIIQMTEVR